MLCSECFRNEGLKREAQNCGVQSQGECPNCGSQAGAKLNSADAYQLMNNFFVAGSVPSNVGGWAPVYMLSENRDQETERFNNELAIDYATLKEATQKVVFDYGPPLWRLGLTDHYDMLTEGGRQDKRL